MPSSVIDLLARPRAFGRFVASALAASASALAEGRSVAVWDGARLCRQHPDGSREPLEQESADETADPT